MWSLRVAALAGVVYALAFGGEPPMTGSGGPPAYSADNPYRIESVIATAAGHPTKCGWGLPVAAGRRRLALAARPVRDATYISPDSAFAVHYDTAGIHSPDLASNRGDGVPDWVVDVAAAMDSSRTLLLDLGFVPALPDADGVYDVYLKEYGGTFYSETILETPGGGGKWVAYMLIDNDFAEDENYYTHGLDAAQVSSAHEYFHAVQLAYGWRATDLYFYELSSTWFEDLAFPEVNDWQFWYDPLGQNPGRNLSRTDGYSVAIFAHYLSENFGPGIMPQIWANLMALGSLASMRESLSAFGTNFTSIWIDFIARLFINSRAPELYFYPDQALLAPATAEAAQVVEGNLRVVFQGLATGTAGIQALAVARPTSLELRVETPPPEYAAKVVLGAGGYGLYNIGLQAWYASDLDDRSEIILVVGADQDSMAITAALSGVQIALNNVYPNPIDPGKQGQLTIGYTVTADPFAGGQSIAIYNLLGQELYRADLDPFSGGGANILQLPATTMQRWPAGIYFLRLRQGDRRAIGRAFTILR